MIVMLGSQDDLKDEKCHDLAEKVLEEEKEKEAEGDSDLEGLDPGMSKVIQNKALKMNLVKSGL